MAEKIKKIPEVKIKKPKKKRRILSAIIFTFFAFLLLLVLLVSVTQTKPFKNWLAGFITDKINESFAQKDSKLTFGSLDGNFFSELVLTNAVLHVKNDDMMKFEKLKVEYDIFQLLNKKINLSEVILLNPEVNFVRVKNVQGDSVYNFAYLFSSDKEKDTEKTDFEWKINVERLKIENLNLVMLDTKSQDVPVSALKIIPSQYLHSSNLKISSFNLETSAYYDKNSAQLQIGYLGFNSNFGFDLKGLSGNFYISKSRAEVNKLNIETSRSWVQMDYAFIDKLDLMNIEGLPSFKGKDMKLQMVAKKIDMDDLKCFLEPLSFLDGRVYCEMKCDGKFNDINIEKCQLKTDNSDMNFHGRMVNLIDPEHLYFDIAGENLTMDPVDTKIYVPGLPVPDYSYLGKVKGSFSYKGEPLNFQTTYDIQSSAGDAKGYFNLNLTTAAFDYSGYAETRGGNIGKVIRDPKLESNLNGKVEFSGSGFTLANIHTKLTYELTNSKFSEYSFENSSGTINLNNYNIEADLKYLSHDVNAQIAGIINIADFNNPHYDLKGKVAGLNIAAFTKNADDKSNLNLSFDVKGNGLSINNIEGDFQMDIANSYYGKFDIPATPVKLIVSTGGAQDNISFTSDLFDFKATGQFKIEQLTETVLSNIYQLNNQISRKFNLDTLLPEQPITMSTSNVNFNYEFKTKNSQAITKLLYFNNFHFDGSAKGYIKNDENGFDAKTDFDISDFAYRDSLILIKKAKISMHHLNNYKNFAESKEGNFASFNSDIVVSADKIKYSTSDFDSIKVDWNLHNEIQSFNLAIKQDSTFKVSTKGNIDLSSDSVKVSIDKLRVFYNKFEVQNDDKLYVSYDPSDAERSFNFRQFVLQSDKLKVEVGGKYSISGKSDLTAELDNISIPKLLQYIYNPQSVYEPEGSRKVFVTPLKGDIRRLLITYKGTSETPVFGLEMNTGLIRYENTKVGRIDAFVDYADEKLSTDVLVSNSLGQGNLRLTGNVPFANPIGETDSAEYFNTLSSPVDIKLRAKDFQINFFSKLIPNFAEVKGFLNGEIASTGTISEPILSGNMNIDKGRFFLQINNLYYRFNASFRTDNSDLIVDYFRIFYVDNDRRHLDLMGKINFAGLRVNYIDLSTSGDVKVLDRSSRLNRFGFYGDMIAGVGNPAVTIKGDLDRLYVSGEVVIKEGNLLFPSIQGLEYNIYADDFIYRILDDSSGTRYLDTTVIVNKEDISDVDPFLIYKYELANKPTSIADNIIYDLHVTTEKNIFANINFNELTREEMFGEISADLRIENKFTKDFNFYGNMEIVGDSYYRIYYKNFKIENSRLTFDGPYDNPALNINAKYRNVTTGKNGEQEIVYVVLKISGFRYKPVLAFSLQDQNGIAIGGPNESSDALSYLIFGVKASDVSSSSSSGILSGLGKNALSNVTSSYLSSLVRDIAPFILNTEVIYEGGSFATGTDIRITSDIGGAIVRFGGKVFSDINNTEVSVEYPLNNILHMNISNNLLLEIKREIIVNSFSVKNSIETGIGLTYKINF